MDDKVPEREGVPGPSPDLVFEVRFPQAFDARDRTRLPLSGKGRILLRGGSVVIEGRERRSFRLARDASYSFTRAQIVNVFAVGKEIRFGVIREGDPSETLLHTCTARAATEDEAWRLVTALPDSISGECRSEIAFHARLSELTPRVIITPALIAVNILIFIFMALFGVGLVEPSVQGLIAWGANFGPLTMWGQWWRLLTSVFIHIGIPHLLLNMWVLNDVGKVVEKMFGHALYLLIYLAAGCLGSMLSISIRPETVSAGASGAIFGLYGALFGFLLRQRQSLPRPVVQKMSYSSMTFIGYNLFYGFARQGIDNGAHIGGLLGGFVLGFVAAAPLDRKTRDGSIFLRVQLVCIAFAALAVCAWYCMPRAPYGRLKQFLDSYYSQQAISGRRYARCMEMTKGGVFTADETANMLQAGCLDGWEETIRMGEGVRLPPSSRFEEKRTVLMRDASRQACWLRMMIAGIRNNDKERIAEASRLKMKIESAEAQVRP